MFEVQLEEIISIRFHFKLQLQSQQEAGKREWWSPQFQLSDYNVALQGGLQNSIELYFAIHFRVAVFAMLY